jgi:hypothetical protein
VGVPVNPDVELLGVAVFAIEPGVFLSDCRDKDNREAPSLAE